MDTRWTGLPTGGGLLPEARRALARIILEVEHLRRETAWECAAARDYREELGHIVDRLEHVRATADGLEHELRSLWQQAALAMG